LSNCVQCDSVITYNCAICKNGFYSNGSCIACNSNCTTCISDTICTGCTLGYTLMEGFSQGGCLECVSPCATCSGSANYCTSCISGFTRTNWKCQNNTYIGFTFVLNADASNVLNNIDTIVQGLLTILNQPSSNVNAITFTSIVSGSTSMTGTVTSTSNSSLASISSSLTVGLASGISGYSVNGVQVTVYGESSTSSSSSSSSNVGLIVGLSVGLTVLVSVIIGAVLMFRKSRLENLKIAAEGTELEMNHQKVIDSAEPSSINNGSGYYEKNT